MIELPTIEKGIPCPVPKPDQRRGRPRSPWPAFLRSLEIGDSFLIEYPAAANVKNIARNLGIALVWRYEGRGPKGMYYERIWRVDR